MTSVASSLQTNMPRSIPLGISNSSYIQTASRESSKTQKVSSSKTSNSQNKVIEGISGCNMDIKTLGGKYRTLMSSPPPNSTDASSDLFLSSSSTSMGYLPQYDAVSRTAQVRSVSGNMAKNKYIFILYLSMYLEDTSLYLYNFHFLIV